ncbi:ATP-binding protein [Comamonas guangdongensis]|uniref:histidine kinase n=1 Tax=Comamonas guangdongensis TaxID=510515 RepID=A0ABV3ZT48_9BURK
MSKNSDSLFRVQRLTERQNMQLLIQLRWIAVIGQVVTISLVHYGFHITLPLLPMALVLVALVATNLAYIYWSQGLHRPVTSRSVFYALLADVLALTIQLYLSGGASNPFIYLYLLQGILSAVLLRPYYTWCVVAASFVGVIGLILFHLPLHVQFESQEGLPSLYVVGVLISFALTSILTIVFLTRIVDNLRRRDTRISDMRQRASEEEHIVRLGLLATGAAHELGTPMATMSVILGDWQHMRALMQDQDLREDLQEMQRQLLRCKSIVSGVLLSAGETRAEGAETTTFVSFVQGIVGHWQGHNSLAHFALHDRGVTDFAMLSDTALQQMICNLLDNALEASPDWVELSMDSDQQQVLLQVRDHGPGFDAAVLQQLGQCHVSTKQERPGRGLGLFLVMNVARALGGQVQARNLPPHEGGGALVEVRLPQSAMAI